MVKYLKLPLRSQNDLRMSAITSSIALAVLASSIRQDKEMKVIKIGKKEIKMLLFTDSMIVYLDSLKQYT